jgi:Protein of unknown function (DUF3237)
VATPTGLAPTYEFTMEIALDTATFVGAGPAGMRAVVGVKGGKVTGERLTGTIVGPGADWALLGGDGYTRVDVRVQIQTADGAFVYVQYVGVLEMTEAVLAAATDLTNETGWDDQYFRMTPRFETGDERYAWLNQSVFVGRGRLSKAGVVYEVYRV